MDQPLSISNSRLTLSLPAHSQSTYTPGSLLLPTLTLKGSPTYTSLTITLYGVTYSRLLLGKLSYVVNDPVVTTNMERDVFLNLEAALLSSRSPEAAAGRVTDSKCSANGEEGVKIGTYELRIPKNLGVLPSLKMFDYSGEAEVKYFLEVKGNRKGMFSVNDRLVLDLKISIPLPAPSPRSLLPAEWPSIIGKKDLKFKTSTGEAIQMTAKLSHLPTSRLAQDVILNLQLSCLQAEHILTSPPPIITAYISRILLSRETDSVTLGRLTKTILKGSIEFVGGEWNGVIPVGKGEMTIEGRKLLCRYTLTCEIKSTALVPGEDFTISLPILLPSSDQILPSTIRDEPPAFEVCSELPVYSA